MKQFISVDDVPDIDTLIGQALQYKADPFRDKELGVGKRVGLIFFNPSMRTRLSTQIAAKNLGMEAIVFNAGGDGWSLEFEEGAIMNGSSVEHIKDAAPVLGAYFDILCIRTFPALQNRGQDYSEHVIQAIIKYSGLPVVSLESATLHPLQSLADAITITEQLVIKNKPKAKVVLTWAPHIKPIPQCVANSFAQWMTAWDKADVTIVQPEGFELSPSFTRGANILHNQKEALQDADFVYVKNWSSYEDYGHVMQHGNDWMLTDESLKHSPEAAVMHCLPLRRNIELSDSLLDSERSIVTQQAANRVWGAQAVLSNILQNGRQQT
jgi:N-succinyl-L-ornithine transcarbamylase